MTPTNKLLNEIIGAYVGLIILEKLKEEMTSPDENILLTAMQNGVLNQKRQ